MLETLPFDSERRRLLALRDLKILDTAPELEFEALVSAAALVCGTPISLISLVDMDRQWFKANIGLPGVTETSRDVSFCAHAIHDDRLMEVEDASTDPRFADNPLVTGDPDIRFYAGVPLSLMNGANVGTLCVIDRQPRTLTQHQRDVLTHLGYAAARALEARIAILHERELLKIEAMATSILEHSGDAIITMDLDGTVQQWNPAAERLFGFTPAEIVGKSVGILIPQRLAHEQDISARLSSDGNSSAYETFRTTRDGKTISVSVTTGAVYSPTGDIIAATEIVRDITESVRAREALEASEQRLENIIEGTQVGTWEWNVQTGEMRCNAQWAANAGWTLDELAPISIKTWEELAHPDDLYSSAGYLQDHFDGKDPVYKFEARLKHRGGYWVWILDRGRVLTSTSDGKPEWMFGTSQDITLRKVQEQSLQKSQEFLDRTGRLAGIGGWEVDLRSGDIQWSDETCRIHGVEVGYRPKFDEAINFYPAEARPIIEAAVQESIATGKGWDLELPFNKANGDRIWVRSVGSAEFSNGQAFRISGAFQDISERVHQQMALDKANERIAIATENGSIGIWDADLKQGHSYYSEMWCKLIGYSREEIDRATGTWLDFVHPDDRARAKAADKDHIAGRTAYFEEQFRMRHKDGHWVWILDRGRVLERDTAGNPTRMLGTHTDITTQKSAEHERALIGERIAIATDSGGIGIWDADIANNSVTWDPWMYRLWGLPERQGARPSDVWSRHIHPEDLARIELAMDMARRGLKGLAEEFRILWPDQSLHHIRMSAKVITDDQGTPVRLIGAAWDVTREQQMTAMIAEQHELMRVTLHSIGDAVITTDALGIVQWLNPVAERMTGWTSEDGVGQQITRVFNIVHEETRQRAPDPIAACLELVEVVGLDEDTVLLAKDGRQYGIEDSAAPIRSSTGDILGAVLVFHDVSEQRRLTQEMRHRASHDALTGLVNRAEFDRRLGVVFDRSAYGEKPNALLYIDLDQFKIVNDSCGHTAGDDLLKQISRLLTEIIRPGDTLARLGGDEFAVILDNCSLQEAEAIAQRICDRMSDFRFLYDDKRFRVGASIGLVPIEGSLRSLAAILQAADASCYAAKEAGRNRVHVWVNSDVALLERSGEMRWASRIEQALDDDLFVLYFQEIVPLDATGSDGRHGEVLLRMMDGADTVILPGAFLPSAERFNLATRIDRWVLEHALLWLTQHPGSANVGTICVNLSGQSVGDRSFHRDMVSLLGTAGPGVCSRLCLEITETAAITRMADATAFIDQVRGLGVRVALDDFGAGASSFGYLKHFPVDYLKIDGQFIRELMNDPLSEATVRCFVEISGLLGLKTVAEYVGGSDVVARLRNMGVDYAQGFYIHKPEPLLQMT